MITRSELPTIKSSAQVTTAIGATDGTNSAVAANLSIKRWVAVMLRQLYNLRRI